ncbi:MAG: heavy metal translocating P-type ATPase [Bryobacteraceae bacterium]
MSSTAAGVTSSVTCDLCGLSTAAGTIARGSHKFCCAGCANVYEIFEQSGVIQGDFRNSELYQSSLKMGLISNPTEHAAPTLNVPEGTEVRESVYRLSGLWCNSCGWLIEHALCSEPGILSADVSFTSDLLRVRYYPQYVVTGRIASRVESLGYHAETSTGDTAPAAAARRDLLLRTGIAAFLWMNVMLFSLVVYASYFEKISPWAQRAIPPILMALATPAIFYSGKPILRAAWIGLKNGAIRMETLVSTGILAAYIYSASQIFLGGKHFYFDTACAIVTLVLAGKALEQGAKERTRSSLALLHQMMPSKARIVESNPVNDNRERFVSVDALAPEMIFRVKPGERIPADGLIVRGETAADESLLTGESVPRRKNMGDEVSGGSLNGAGVIEVRVTRTAKQSVLAQIVQSVENALATRTALDRSVDRLSRIFVPVVMALAIATAIVCVVVGVPVAESLMRAIAVLVIACPCALGIATPLATTNAIGAASRIGVLVRDPSILEAAHKLNWMVLDKTGTVTEGKFRVQETWWSARWSGRGPQLFAALESVSEHPIGKAIAGNAPLQHHPQHIEVLEGRGIRGIVDGLSIAVGSQSFIAPFLEEPLRNLASGWEQDGLTVVYGSIEGELAGAIALGDALRSDAKAFVDELRGMGIQPVLLSGDSKVTTARIAARLGIEQFRGEVLPSEKLTTIDEYRQQGRSVAMMGDGINDAPALAAADIGIAMGSGTDLAAYTAPVVLISPSLLRITAALRLAGKTRRIVSQNLFWAFFYNTLGIGLAAAGILNPLLAAGAMVLSSLTVVANSRRAA